MNAKERKYLLQSILDRIDAKSFAVQTESGWQTVVKMKDVENVIDEVNREHDVSADVFANALKAVADAQFGFLNKKV